MRELSKAHSALMLLGAACLVIGVVMQLLGIGMRSTPIIADAAPVIFLAGAILFASLQMLQTYDGMSITIKRLCRIRTFAGICLIIAGLLMLEQHYQIIRPYVATSLDGYRAYVQYVHNNWVVALLIAGILQLYATLRISNELKK